VLSGYPLKAPPKTLGRFEVGAKIGGGGMATVYLGRDVQADGTETFVALKVIRDELANDEQFTAMFIDEAKILARLSHPNCIQTLEYGVSDENRFIAMELLNGRTIADVWETLAERKEGFELGTAAWICARVAEGLHSAHELIDETGQPLGIIHRDVNPSNIFVTYDGEVKLIDFGLARARVRISKSAEGIVKGKIPYLAPEQVFAKPFDRRVDLYALGTTLWELVSMKRLFKRENDIETLKAIRDAHVPDLRADNPDFPEALWKILDRSLRRDPDERYATAEEMRTDLDAFARASAPHVIKVSKIVTRLFPEGEARLTKWMHDAAGRVPGERTLMPPAPVPIASSTLLEGETRGSSSLPAMPAATKVPDVPESEPAKEPEKAEEPKVAKKAVTVSTPPKAKKSSKVKPHKESRKSKRARPSQRPPPAPPPNTEDKQKLWMVVVVVVAVLLALALLASR
jgi:serine/threonine-protein kinase